MSLAAAGFARAECLDAPADVAAWWPGDASAEDIVGDNDGVLGTSTTFGDGEVGQAFHLPSGTTDTRVMIPADTALDVGTAEGFTIEFWVNPASNAVREPVIEWNRQSGSPNWGVHLWLATIHTDPNPHAGNVYVNLVDTTGASHILNSANGFIEEGVFQHLALTYDKTSGVATIYRNGAVIVTSNLGTFTPQTSYDLYFGSRPGPVEATQFSGLIDEVSLYARALAAEEILAVYDAASFGKCVVVCGDTNGDREIKASDALFVLRSAVGTQSCDFCFCDLNGSNSVTAGDALSALRIAVGVDVATTCPGCT